MLWYRSVWSTCTYIYSPHAKIHFVCSKSSVCSTSTPYMNCKRVPWSYRHMCILRNEEDRRVECQKMERSHMSCVSTTAQPFPFSIYLEAQRPTMCRHGEPSFSQTMDASTIVKSVEKPSLHHHVLPPHVPTSLLPLSFWTAHSLRWISST